MKWEEGKGERKGTDCFKKGIKDGSSQPFRAIKCKNLVEVGEFCVFKTKVTKMGSGNEMCFQLYSQCFLKIVNNYKVL